MHDTRPVSGQNWHRDIISGKWIIQRNSASKQTLSCAVSSRVFKHRWECKYTQAYTRLYRQHIHTDIMRNYATLRSFAWYYITLQLNSVTVSTKTAHCPLTITPCTLFPQTNCSTPPSEGGSGHTGRPLYSSCKWGLAPCW
jgi:hypothetical protein